MLSIETLLHVGLEKVLKGILLSPRDICFLGLFIAIGNREVTVMFLVSLLEGGCPPKFIIIDDGWQDTFDEFNKEGEPCAEGTQYVITVLEQSHVL